MKALRQPIQQTRLGAAQIHTTDANLRESKLTGPSLDQGNELSVIERHPPIVKSLLCPDEAGTQALAENLAANPVLRNAFIELQGDLGAGKTTLVRHLLRALGVQGRIKSPTYAVVEAYEVSGADADTPFNTPLNIWHFDFYRFQDPQEWEDAGFRDIFTSPGLKLAEWPDKVGELLPRADLTIHLAMLNDETRRLTLTTHSATGEALLHSTQSLEGILHRKGSL
jgi:tRNA threonylcarbamoyladenosine biosynthesis protein TsaE